MFTVFVIRLHFTRFLQITQKNYTLCYLKRLGKLWTLPTKGLSIDPLSINGTVRQLVQSGRAQHEVRNVVCRQPTQLTKFVFTNARVPPPSHTQGNFVSPSIHIYWSLQTQTSGTNTHMQSVEPLTQDCTKCRQMSTELCRKRESAVNNDTSFPLLDKMSQDCI